MGSWHTVGGLGSQESQNVGHFCTDCPPNTVLCCGLNDFRVIKETTQKLRGGNRKMTTTREMLFHTWQWENWVSALWGEVVRGDW